LPRREKILTSLSKLLNPLNPPLHPSFQQGLPLRQDLLNLSNRQLLQLLRLLQVSSLQLLLQHLHPQLHPQDLQLLLMHHRLHRRLLLRKHLSLRHRKQQHLPGLLLLQNPLNLLSLQLLLPRLRPDLQLRQHRPDRPLLHRQHPQDLQHRQNLPNLQSQIRLQ
jgi:hypothetical protein